MESLLQSQQNELASDVVTPNVPLKLTQKKHMLTAVLTVFFVVLTASAVMQTIEMVRLRGYLSGMAASHASDGRVATAQGSTSPRPNTPQGQAQVGLPSQVGGC